MYNVKEGVMDFRIPLLWVFYRVFLCIKMRNIVELMLLLLSNLQLRATAKHLLRCLRWLSSVAYVFRKNANAFFDLPYK